MQAAFAFPVEGLHRTPETLAVRFGHIAAVVHAHYDAGLVWGGLALFAGLAAVRRWWVLLASLAAIAAFSVLDFQGYPDVYPLLPYAALGIAAAVAIAGRARPVAVAGLVALVAVSWTQFAPDDTLIAQEAEAASLQRMLEPSQSLYALGDPTPLVLTGRRNASRYIFLGSGVGEWDQTHTRGGVIASLRRADPAVVVLHGWRSALERRVATWLHTEYVPRWDGDWRVFLRPDVAVRLDGARPPEDPAYRRQQLLHRADQGGPEDHVPAV